MDEKSPLITAVIPVYNRPDQVIEALRSVLAQSYRPLELIIGDDGSTDHSLSEIDSYLAGNKGIDINIRILELEHSGFPGKVRNLCAAEAGGDFLAFLDSDDVWHPDKLELQYSALHKGNADCLLSHTREEWNRSGKIISQSKMRHNRAGNVFPDALEKCMIGPSTVMISKALYIESGGFRDDLEIAEDYEYWLRLTALHEVAYLDQALTIKNAGHEGQLSEKYGQIEIFRIEGLKDLVDQHFFSDEKNLQARAELSRKCFVYGRGCLKRDKLEEGQKYMDLAKEYEQL